MRMHILVVEDEPDIAESDPALAGTSSETRSIHGELTPIPRTARLLDPGDRRADARPRRCPAAAGSTGSRRLAQGERPDLARRTLVITGMSISTAGAIDRLVRLRSRRSWPSRSRSSPSGTTRYARQLCDMTGRPDSVGLTVHRLTQFRGLAIVPADSRRRGQVVRQRSAKPLFAGSNPAAASKHNSHAHTAPAASFEIVPSTLTAPECESATLRLAGRCRSPNGCSNRRSRVD